MWHAEENKAVFFSSSKMAGRLLTKDRFISKVQLTLSEAGVNSGHSFSIGAATTAGRKGVY